MKRNVGDETEYGFMVARRTPQFRVYLDNLFTFHHTNMDLTDLKFIEYNTVEECLKEWRVD